MNTNRLYIKTGKYHCTNCKSHTIKIRSNISNKKLISYCSKCSTINYKFGEGLRSNQFQKLIRYFNFKCIKCSSDLGYKVDNKVLLCNVCSNRSINKTTNNNYYNYDNRSINLDKRTVTIPVNRYRKQIDHRQMKRIN